MSDYQNNYLSLNSLDLVTQFAQMQLSALAT